MNKNYAFFPLARRTNRLFRLHPSVRVCVCARWPMHFVYHDFFPVIVGVFQRHSQRREPCHTWESQTVHNSMCSSIAFDWYANEAHRRAQIQKSYKQNCVWWTCNVRASPPLVDAIWKIALHSVSFVGLHRVVSVYVRKSLAQHWNFCARYVMCVTEIVFDFCWILLFNIHLSDVRVMNILHTTRFNMIIMHTPTSSNGSSSSKPLL